ncbi:MAG: hypothetical protein HOO06_16800 [Bdellovibrionaceae bacterium]|nr:hypothetical protein [Pseudobdellovibrionaceae bacterium]
MSKLVYVFFLISIYQAALANITNYNNSLPYSTQYQCQFVDELDIPTGESLSVSQFSYFSLLRFSNSAFPPPLFGRPINKTSDKVVNKITSQIGPVEGAYFFQDQAANRYRIIISTQQLSTNNFYGFLINTSYTVNEQETSEEQILYQADLTCRRTHLGE